MDQQEQTKRERLRIMSRVVVKSWTDPEFANRLQSNPLEVLSEEGLELEEGQSVEVSVHFDSDTHKNIVIPTPPDLLSIAEEHLLAIAAQRLAIQLELF